MIGTPLWLSGCQVRLDVGLCSGTNFFKISHASPQLYQSSTLNHRSELGQQSLDGGVDIASSSDERPQVGLAVDEAHGAELVELLLETDLRGLK